MESSWISSFDTRHVSPKSSTGSLTSPVTSIWSRGHSNKSSISSITSSPLPSRESFEAGFNNAKRLEDVREEPQEQEEAEKDFQSSFENYDDLPSSPFGYQMYSDWPANYEYSLGGEDDSHTTWPSNPYDTMRRTSLDSSIPSTQLSTSRFGSFSRRWKNRSAVSPQLSIITHTAPAGLARSRSDATTRTFSPAIKAVAKHHSRVPSSPIHDMINEAVEDDIDASAIRGEEDANKEEDCHQAHTPLLPPLKTNLKLQRDSPIQSPLQSPSIAPAWNNVPTSADLALYSNLPSPPLSHRPSLSSIPTSWQHTATNQIPHLCLSEEHADFWAMRLGHADFSIHPEPYLPEITDIEAYREFRANWDQARKQYTQHLARTAEHYGETSKVFRLTEEKWKTIDDVWKLHDTNLHKTISPSLARLSDDISSPTSPSSSSILERPAERVVVPTLDQKGKFPQIGDSDIVGPLSIGTAKVPELQRNQDSPPPSTESLRKRNLVKLFSDIFTRH